MMITAELASLHRLAIERRLTLQDDSPQPVMASATLNSRRPALVPERNVRIGHDQEATGETPSEIVAPHHDRRQGDQQGDSAEQRNDRRKQTLPTLIDTRTARARRKSDHEMTIDFQI